MSNVPLALLAARMFSMLEDRDGALVAVLASEHRAEGLARLLAEMAPDRPVRFFPAWDCLPFDRSAPSPDAMGRRMRVLRDLAAKPDRTVVVTTPEATLQRVPPARAVADEVVLKRGEPLDPAGLEATLLRFGYAHADEVDEPGRFAVRGEVVDLFPAGPRPYRLTVLDGRIGSIHRYDPASQRSTKAEVARIRVGPVTEMPEPEGGDGVERAAGAEHWLPLAHPDLATLFAFLPDAPVTVEPQAETRAEAVLAQIGDAYRDRVAADAADASAPRKALPPERLYLTRDE